MLWMLKLVGDYLRLILFAACVLIGVQVPGFISQYEQRVDAHLVEAKQNLAGFQFTADRYFQGDIKQLIAHYRASSDQVFVQDANSIESISSRVSLLTAEYNALQVAPLKQALHLAFSGDKSLFIETYDGFSFTVPLSLSALFWGGSVALVLLLLLDSGLFTVRKVVSKKRKSPHHS